MKEEKGKEKWMAADLLFFFSTISVGDISLFKQRAQSVLWWVERPYHARSPFAQSTGQLQSQLQITFFIQGPLII